MSAGCAYQVQSIAVWQTEIYQQQVEGRGGDSLLTFVRSSESIDSPAGVVDAFGQKLPHARAILDQQQPHSRFRTVAIVLVESLAKAGF